MPVDPHEFGISYVADMFSTSRYASEFPSTGFIVKSSFTERLAGFYAGMSIKDCPASVLVRVENAILSDSVIHCASGRERRIIYETHRPNDREAVRLAQDPELDTADRTRFNDDGWNALFLGSAGSFNYGHWIVDDLPRAKAAAYLLNNDNRPLRIVLTSYGDAIDRIRIESLHLILNSPVHIDLIDRGRPTYFKNLHYASPVSEHPLRKSPIALDYCARRVLANLKGYQDPDVDNGMTRLFVVRSRARGRSLSNEDEVRALMRSRGFKIIDTDGMSFAGQVYLFAAAHIVIGQMGASMTNTLFCRPTTTVIHLAPEGWIEPFYWDLAVVRGHVYKVLFGEINQPALPSHLSDYTIPMDALRAVVESF